MYPCELVKSSLFLLANRSPDFFRAQSELLLSFKRYCILTFFLYIYLFTYYDSIYFRDQLYSSLLFIRSAMKSMKQEMNLYVKIKKQKCYLIVSDLKYFSDLYQNHIFGVLFYRHFVVRDMWPLVASDAQTYLQSCIQIFHEST